MASGSTRGSGLACPLLQASTFAKSRPLLRRLLLRRGSTRGVGLACRERERGERETTGYEPLERERERGRHTLGSTRRPPGLLRRVHFCTRPLLQRAARGATGSPFARPSEDTEGPLMPLGRHWKTPFRHWKAPWMARDAPPDALRMTIDAPRMTSGAPSGGWPFGGLEFDQFGMRPSRHRWGWRTGGRTRA